MKTWSSVVQSEIHSYEEKAVNTYGKMPKKAVVRLIAFWQRPSSRFTRGSPCKCDLRGSYKCQSIAEPGNWNFSYLVRYQVAPSNEFLSISDDEEEQRHQLGFRSQASAENA